MRNKNLISYVKNQIKDRVWEKDIPTLKEESILEEYRGYIEKRISSKIHINSNFDPKKRLQKAVPFKPAIYIDI